MDIRNEQDESGRLDKELREWEKKIRQKLSETGGANASSTFTANVRKQERVLENRLETVRMFIDKSSYSFHLFLQALQRFNSLLTTNSLLRSEIDNLRNERERFENLSQKSENELKELRAQLVSSIEKSVTAYDQR